MCQLSSQVACGREVVLKIPYSYQEEAIQLGLERNMLCLDEWGLGKTLIATEIARRFPRQNLPKLIISRLVNLAHWEAHIREQMEGQDPEIHTITVKTKFTAETFRNRNVWLLMHPEALLRHAAILANIFFSIVVVDEAHKFRSRMADRTAALKKLPALRKVAMTATPLDKAPNDLWALLHWLYPERYRGYFAFVDKHCLMTTGYGGHPKILPGAKNPEALAAELAPFTLARTKVSVAPELPPNIITTQMLEMSDLQRKLYKRVAQELDVIVHFDDIVHDLVDPEHLPEPMLLMNTLARMQKLMQIAVDPDLVLAVHNESPWSSSCKLSWFEDNFEEHRHEPTLYLTQYPRVADKIANRYRLPRVTGVRKDDISHQPMHIVGTIGAAGESLDLPHIKTTVFLDMVYSSANMQQAMNRHHRITVTEPKQTVFLLAWGSMDVDILDAVMGKITMIDLLLNSIRTAQQYL